jgi:threonyl-tRNA synthetase
MYPAMDVDGTDYYMKPMNCPHHHKIYANTPKVIEIYHIVYLNMELVIDMKNQVSYLV